MDLAGPLAQKKYGPKSSYIGRETHLMENFFEAIDQKLEDEIEEVDLEVSKEKTIIRKTVVEPKSLEKKKETMNDVTDTGKGQANTSDVEQNKEEPKRISTSTEASQTPKEAVLGTISSRD